MLFKDQFSLALDSRASVGHALFRSADSFLSQLSMFAGRNGYIFYLSTMKQLIIFCLVAGASLNQVAAQTFSHKNFTQLSWLTGSWKMQLKNGLLYEQWHEKDDSTLESRGFIIKNGTDTILLETVQIKFRKNMLYYVPTVNGQNNNEAVVFIITAATGQSFTAGNAAHDFPQQIYYQRKGDAAMYAAVSGKQKGIIKKEEFNFTKE